MAMNKVLMVGRITVDPELKQTNSGTGVTRFSIAVNMATNKTDFFNVVAWKQTATFITRYFHKGDGICIDGHLESRTYEKDGVKHTVYEVICDNAGFAEGRASTDGGQPPSLQARESALPQFEEVTDDGTLPF